MRPTSRRLCRPRSRGQVMRRTTATTAPGAAQTGPKLMAQRTVRNWGTTLSAKKARRWRRTLRSLPSRRDAPTFRPKRPTLERRSAAARRRAGRSGRLGFTPAARRRRGGDHAVQFPATWSAIRSGRPCAAGQLRDPEAASDTPLWPCGWSRFCGSRACRRWRSLPYWFGRHHR